MTKRCDFCEREFEKPDKWYILEDGLEACKHCNDEFEDDEKIGELND